MNKFIELNPAIANGQPIIVGTRIPVWCVLEALADVGSIDLVISEHYNQLTKEQIVAALFYASDKIKK